MPRVLELSALRRIVTPYFTLYTAERSPARLVEMTGARAFVLLQSHHAARPRVQEDHLWVPVEFM